MAKIKAIGIIAEDDSDFESIKILTQRIANKENLTFKKFTSNGCGKLRRKCRDYAINLKTKGCNMLLVVHDLDRNKHSALLNDLKNKLNPTPIGNYLICIPVEELEAWFLSDARTLKNIYSFSAEPKIKGGPETIASPKEELGKIVEKSSNKQKVYLNTKHNSVIAEKINIDLINLKCPSFKPFYDFVSGQKY